ncbi:hypothetical protein C8F04DRAFT_1182023 [Mycena alexandri]|uniref:Uncharacterized protein n=1 Tax=Mycena alexandri TaxID=1745969 RepID=A0AAD6T0K1_9AGAR|nr:hypothetical protein C8F04DRAFT_1182023 [Mycena alexandri]
MVEKDLIACTLSGGHPGEREFCQSGDDFTPETLGKRWKAVYGRRRPPVPVPFMHFARGMTGRDGTPAYGPRPTRKDGDGDHPYPRSATALRVAPAVVRHHLSPARPVTHARTDRATSRCVLRIHCGTPAHRPPRFALASEIAPNVISGRVRQSGMYS